MIDETDIENHKILLLEDDPEQMDLMVSFVGEELRKITDDENISTRRRKKLQSIQIIKATNIKSLKSAVEVIDGVLLAVLDCNTPDEKDGEPNDQFVKTKHKITGQHQSVDIVRKGLPDTPITMVSSLNRFKTIINQYYQKEYDINVNFIRKADAPIIQRNIRYYLRKYLKSL